MTGTERSAQLATAWIDAWNTMDLAWLREHLAPDFIHVSPFGRLGGRDAYLATVVPLARASVRALTVRHVLADGDRAAVWFDNATTRGVIPSCDWLRVAEDQILHIHSFYDPTLVQAALAPDEQQRLRGTTS